MPKPGEITADASLAQAKKTSAAFKSLVQNPHGHHGDSVREDYYKGHRIVIRTKYEIEIDGHPFPGNLDVSNSGTVQYHGIPNVSSNSAVDLIRSVIDAFPDDFKGHAGDEHPHGDHEMSGTGAMAHGHHAAKPRSAARGKNRKPSTGKSAPRGKRHARSSKHSH
jgi:hypothetical protein